MGTRNDSDSSMSFNFKVVVANGIATIYIDGYNCGSFDLSTINPGFDLSSTISVELCVKDVYLSSGGYIYLSNWGIVNNSTN